MELASIVSINARMHAYIEGLNSYSVRWTQLLLNLKVDPEGQRNQHNHAGDYRNKSLSVHDAYSKVVPYAPAVGIDSGDYQHILFVYSEAKVQPQDHSCHGKGHFHPDGESTY